MTLSMTPRLTFYGEKGFYPVTAFTSCGAPTYDIARPRPIPAKGLGSANDRLLLTTGEYGKESSWMRYYDLATGIVDDAVFELKLEPANWDRLRFEK